MFFSRISLRLDVPKIRQNLRVYVNMGRCEVRGRTQISALILFYTVDKL